MLRACASNTSFTFAGASYLRDFDCYLGDFIINILYCPRSDVYTQSYVPDTSLRTHHSRAQERINQYSIVSIRESPAYSSNQLASVVKALWHRNVVPRAPWMGIASRSLSK